MTDTTPTQQDRDALAWMIHQAGGCGYQVTPAGPGPKCPPHEEDFAAAAAILASAWLAKHVRANQAEAWARGAKAQVARPVGINPYLTTEGA